jgi:hypothetical protein
MTCYAGLPEIHSQKELSRIVGEFSPSRYVIYKRSDKGYHYFQETGKFGWLGPSGKFRISRSLISFKTSIAGSVIRYDQNRSLFTIGYAPYAQVIKADFLEKYTKEEEHFLKSVDELNHFSASDFGTKKIQALNKAMRFAYAANHFIEADLYAKSSIELAAQQKDNIELYSEVIHSGKRIRGLVALRHGDVTAAESYLIASAQVPGSAVLKSFGPNMMLAKELLLIGEHETVIDYLNLCKKFWNNKNLELWEAEIKNNKIPEFGANLSY